MTHYDVAVIGGGVSGTALLYVLRNYTDVQRIGFYEKHDDVAQVASHTTQNSQTLHYGDIETNYSREKAEEVSNGARLVEHYVERVATDDKVFDKQHKMVIAVGDEEVAALRERYEEFQDLFPKLKLLEREAVAEVEPKIIEGRDPEEDVIALYSPNGYIMDYRRLARSFYDDVKDDERVDAHLGVRAQNFSRKNKKYTFQADGQEHSADVLIADAGAMSIKIAKELGYAEHLGILSVAGNFYVAEEQLLTGKVYTMQLEKLPFAAPHGDPDVHDKTKTRFGPSAKPLLMLERWNYGTVTDYLKSFSWTLDGLKTILNIMGDPVYLKFMALNLLYDVPVIGPRLFARNVYKIIPTLKASDIKKDKGYGGTRPQIIDTKKHELAMGEARIEEDRAVFNITPSPGASMCLQNAVRDARLISEWTGCSFDEKQLDKDLR